MYGLKTETVVSVNEYRPISFKENLLSFYAELGIPDERLASIRYCSETGYTVGKFECGSQDIQFCPHGCSDVELCGVCGERESRRLANDVIKNDVEPVYSLARLPLAYDNLVFTVPKRCRESIDDYDVFCSVVADCIRQAYPAAGTDEILGFEVVPQSWGDLDLSAGFEPHIHAIVYSLLYNRKTHAVREHELVGKVLKRDAFIPWERSLRENYTRRMKSAFSLSYSGIDWDVNRSCVSASWLGVERAYGRLYHNCKYNYRFASEDLLKSVKAGEFVTHSGSAIFVRSIKPGVGRVVKSVEFDSKRKANLLRLLDFHSLYPNKSGKRFRRIRRYGWMSDPMIGRVIRALADNLGIDVAASLPVDDVLGEGQCSLDSSFRPKVVWRSRSKREHLHPFAHWRHEGCYGELLDDNLTLDQARSLYGPRLVVRASFLEVASCGVFTG